MEDLPLYFLQVEDVLIGSVHLQNVKLNTNLESFRGAGDPQEGVCLSQRS